MKAEDILAQFNETKDLNIVLYGDPILREKGQAIPSFGQGIKNIFESMYALLQDTPTGIGLAAQQVGIALNFFIIHIEDTDEGCIYDGKAMPQSLIMPLAFANTRIVEESQELATYDESCLSLPNVDCPVTRPERIKVQFQDLNGTSHTLECSGLLSTCIQHEYDHTEGRLIIDYLDKLGLSKVQTKLKQLKRQTKLKP